MLGLAKYPRPEERGVSEEDVEVSEPILVSNVLQETLRNHIHIDNHWSSGVSGQQAPTRLTQLPNLNGPDRDEESQVPDECEQVDERVFEVGHAAVLSEVHQANGRSGGGQSERDVAEAPCVYVAMITPVVPMPFRSESSNRGADEERCCESTEEEREHAERADMGHVDWIAFGGVCVSR